MKYHTEKIEAMIYTIRGQKVILDCNLAKLYGVETGTLNRQVKRNLKRFPPDFMFQLTATEEDSLRCQIGISNRGKGGRRYLPYVFTENGVAMLSSVLSSEIAIEINIAIMRTFTILRTLQFHEKNDNENLNDLKTSTNSLFKIVFERLDNLEEQIAPKLPLNRKKIGLKPEQKG